MISVITDISAINAQSANRKSFIGMNKSMEKLVSGKQLNAAKDDAAGMAVSSKTTAELNVQKIGIRAASDAISILLV